MSDEHVHDAYRPNTGVGPGMLGPGKAHLAEHGERHVVDDHRVLLHQDEPLLVADAPVLREVGLLKCLRGAQQTMLTECCRRSMTLSMELQPGQS